MCGFSFHTIPESLITFHSGERIHKVADSYAGFTRYVWTEAVSRKKKLRIKKYADTFGQGLTCVISNISFVNF